MFDFIVVLGSFIDIMMSEIDKAEKKDNKTTSPANAKVSASTKKNVSNETNNRILPAEYFNNIILPTVSCDAFGETAESRRRYSNIAMDIYKIVPSASVRSTVDSDVVLHLCCHWNAGVCTL